jgi:thiosulfate reductase cytochrome b subunit
MGARRRDGSTMEGEKMTLEPRVLIAITVLAGAALPWAAPSSAQAEACAECHDTQVAETSVHAGFECGDCHGSVDLDLHPEDVVSGDAVCGGCHDAGESVAESVHGAVGVACADCHGVGHEILPLADAAAPMAPLQQIGTCGTCHDADSDLLQGYLTSIHGRALFRAGLVTAAPSCSDCHSAHDILPPTEAASAVSHENVPATCGNCHQAILDVWRDESAHGTAWQADDPNAPVCTTCHTSHNIRTQITPEARLEWPETCEQCHSGRFSTFRDSFHGQATNLGFVIAAVCSDCHTPHQNLPASDPGSSIHPDRLQATCQTCHPSATEAFVSFDPHADPKSPDSRIELRVIYILMVSLLFGVFGFFGLHDVLWLQRSLVAMARGEVQVAHTPDEKWVQRFTPFQIRMHVVVIVTFLVLAATGLPLKYHELGWAQLPIDLMGGVAGARFLHRLAAILTFGYFFVHVAAVLWRALGRREKGMFWGWKSMMPRGKDFADLWNNLKYFVYAGERPRFDRWSYWEKFDYFAVFWGVAIIGCSGLFLWFPELVARYLPGWTLNVAHIIHSDEALLAVGFIFVFHFFHTHFRPESFPMDRVVFVGSMPLSRFEAEKPDEYARLVAQGELESRLVDPPSRAQLTRSFAWGCVAVVIGLLLVFGILWGMIAH